MYNKLYTQSNNALIIISTPITLTIFATIPSRPSHEGTLSIKIQPINIRIAVCNNAFTIIIILYLYNESLVIIFTLYNTSYKQILENL